MKRLTIYLLAASLACGFVVSLGYAQAPQALEHAPPFVLPPTPTPRLITGCWEIIAIINVPIPQPPPQPPLTGNVAVKLQGANSIYLKVATQEGTRAYGTLYVPAMTRKYPIDGFINGTNVSAFTNTTTYGEEHRYITSTLTEESEQLVMYGMSILSTPYPAIPGTFLNEIATFKGTRIGEVEYCPNY